MRIRPKLQIAFFSASTILIVSIMIVTYFSIGKYFEQEEGNRLKENIRYSAKSINNSIIQKVKTFDVLSSNPVFNMGSNEIISRFLSKKVSDNTFYNDFFFFKKNGIILSSSDPKFIGVNISQIALDVENKLAKAIEKGHKSVYSSSSQKKTKKNTPLNAELLSTVTDLNGNVIGRLVGLVNFKYLRKRIFKLDEETFKNGYTYILEGNNVILTSDSIALNTGYEVLPKDFLLEFKKNKNNFYIYENSKGIKTMLAYARLLKRGPDGNFWALVSVVPYYEVMLPVYQMIFDIFLVFLLITSILIVLIVTFSRTISKPIIKLEKAISNFEINKKPINIKSNNKDEIGHLYSAFNTMTENLYSSYIIESHLVKEKDVIEANLIHFIESANAPIFGIDNKGHINEWNIASEKITGYKKEEALGKNIVQEFVPKEYRKSVKRVLYDALKGKETANFEFPLFTKGKQRVMILLNSSTRRDINGEIIGVIGVGQNITERIKKETYIKQLNLAINSSANEVYIFDAVSLKFSYVNKGAIDALGYTIDELLTMSPIDILPKQTAKTFSKILESFHQKESDKFQIESNHQRKDKTTYPVSVTLTQFTSNNKLFYLALVVDITERIEKETYIKQLDLAINSSVNEVLMFDVETFKFSYANKGAIDALGYTIEELLTMTPIDLVPAQTPEKFSQLMANLSLKDNEKLQFLSVHQRKDKTTYPISVTLTQFTSNHRLFCLALIVDVTERIKKEEQFRLVVESVPNALILVNSVGKITLINKQTEIEFGYTPEELIGKKMEVLIPNRYKKEHPGHVSKYMTAPETRAMGKKTEIYALRKNGVEFPVEVGLNPIETSQGAFIMASIVNIAERKEHEAILKDKEKQAKELSYATAKIAFQKESLNKEKELNELKSRFVSTASHEFRTPLSAINFAAGSIKKYWAKMEPIMIEKKLRKIESQVLHMTTLLDDILIVGQADAGKIKNKPLNINLGNFIDEIIKEASNPFEKPHEIVVVDKEKLKSGDIFIDEKVGRNVFSNLLSNAIKFSPDVSKVTVELSSEKDNIIISIIDFGIGISKSELKNIFNPFFRGKNVDLIQGTGLGLTIVKDAIDAIGGEIIVKSNLGKGSSFIVKIPKNYV